MPDRLMDVNAYTTLDFAEAVVTGEEFEEETVAVLDATTDREDPECVRLRLEVDNATEKHLPVHMEELRLTPDQARTLAGALEKYADRVEQAQSG
ncbi:DUF6360 family protein [Halobacteria archaeon AArc-m2/3/4]|uniref:DUF6360 family protein n=1 Tax=Natronoglomus mannanivorans TaxID=2979990 RepID=A0ABT2QHM9_9EURY|nr:DUF6360 family protein [Halobacteria archaeon AArc-m2/3/4]